MLLCFSALLPTKLMDGEQPDGRRSFCAVGGSPGCAKSFLKIVRGCAVQNGWTDRGPVWNENYMGCKAHYIKRNSDPR